MVVSNVKVRSLRFLEDDPDTLIWPQESVPLSEEELKYKAKLLKSIKARQKK